MLDTNFKDIKIIGFDLDQTLYPKSPEIDTAIQKYIYNEIAKKLSITLGSAEEKFKSLYKNGHGLSGRKTLITLGFPEEGAENIIQEALENAEIAKFLHPNESLIKLLKKLGQKYTLDIITGSNLKITTKKLMSLGINSQLFQYLITDENASKSTGEAYRLWLSKYSNYSPHEFLYIGDRPRSDYEVPKTLGIKSILVNVSPNNKYDCIQFPNILDLENVL